MSPKLVARMVTHPSRVLENISVSFLDANASLYWDNTFPVKPFIDKETPQNERRKCQQAIVPQRQVQSIKLLKILYFQMLRVIQYLLASP